MTSCIEQALFPRQYREFPHRRLVMNMLRAGHILSFAVLVGGVFFQQPADVLIPWVLATIATGLAMFLIQLYASFIVLFEVQSIAILIKVLLLRFVPLLDNTQQLILLGIIVVFSSMVSHANKGFRHRNIMSQAFQDKYGYQGKGKQHKQPG